MMEESFDSFWDAELRTQRINVSGFKCLHLWRRLQQPQEANRSVCFRVEREAENQRQERIWDRVDQGQLLRSQHPEPCPCHLLPL